MNNRNKNSINRFLLLSLLLAGVGQGACAEPKPARPHDRPVQNQDFGIKQFLPDHGNNDNEAQNQIEQAADQFDAFALQMPAVIKAKFEAFMKHGFRAILLDDSTTKPAEEKMIKSLTDGLRNIGGALEDDMTNYEKSIKNNPKESAGGLETDNSNSSFRSNRKLIR